MNATLTAKVPARFLMDAEVIEVDGERYVVAQRLARDVEGLLEVVWFRTFDTQGFSVYLMFVVDEKVTTYGRDLDAMSAEQRDTNIVRSVLGGC